MLFVRLRSPLLCNVLFKANVTEECIKYKYEGDGVFNMEGSYIEKQHEQIDGTVMKTECVNDRQQQKWLIEPVVDVNMEGREWQLVGDRSEY